jgi:hypothetical protein
MELATPRAAAATILRRCPLRGTSLTSEMELVVRKVEAATSLGIRPRRTGSPASSLAETAGARREAKSPAGSLAETAGARREAKSPAGSLAETAGARHEAKSPAAARGMAKRMQIVVLTIVSAKGCGTLLGARAALCLTRARDARRRNQQETHTSLAVEGPGPLRTVLQPQVTPLARLPTMHLPETLATIVGCAPGFLLPVSHLPPRVARRPELRVGDEATSHRCLSGGAGGRIVEV